MDKEAEQAIKAWQEYVRKVTAHLSPQEVEEFQEQAAEIRNSRVRWEEGSKGGLEREASDFLKKIIRHCDKKKSLKLLYQVALLATQELNYRQFTHLDWLKVVAKEEGSWPVIKTTTTASTKRMEAFVKKIDLGEYPKSPLRMKAYYSSKNIFQTWALAAYQTIDFHRRGIISNTLVPFIPADPSYPEDHFEIDGSFEVGRNRYYSTEELHKKCVALPELNKGTADKWVVVIKYYLKLATKGYPPPYRTAHKGQSG